MGNFTDSYKSIIKDGLDDWWSGNKTKFFGEATGTVTSLQDGDFVIALKNFPISMAGSSYMSANKTPNNKDGRMFIIGDSSGSITLSGTSSLRVKELHLADKAHIVVDGSANAYIGTLSGGDSSAALTMGGTGFVLGRSITDDSGNVVDQGADGLIQVTGNAKFNGGDYYFKGTGTSAAEAGLTTTGSITIAEGGAAIGTLSLDNAVFQGVNGIDLSVNDLNMTNGAYIRAGNGIENSSSSPISSDINIQAGTIKLTEGASLGRGYTAGDDDWMSKTGETNNITITANIIDVDSSFVLANSKITLLSSGDNSSVSVKANDIDAGGTSDNYRYGIRTNGSIDIGAEDENGNVTDYFDSVTVSDKATIAADSGELKIFAKTITGTGTAQFEARNNKTTIAANTITLNDANSYIKGAGGVEIRNLDNQVLDIKLGSDKDSNPSATSSTLDGYAKITGKYVKIVGANGVNLSNQGAIRATGVDNGCSILLDGQDGGLTLKNMWVEAGNVVNGEVTLAANAGKMISIEKSHIRDDLYDEADNSPEGTLTIAINGLSSLSDLDADIFIKNSRISDDTIHLGSGLEKIHLSTGFVSPDNSLIVKSSSLTLDGTWIGKDPLSKAPNGSVTIFSQETTLNDVPNGASAQIYSDTTLDIRGGQGATEGFAVTMNGTNTISGSTVTIGSADDDRTFSLTGGTITTNGTGDDKSITLNLGKGDNTISGTDVTTTTGSVSVAGTQSGGANLVLSNKEGTTDDAAVINGNSVTISGVQNVVVTGNSADNADSNSHITATGTVDITASGKVDLGAEGWIKGGGAVNIKAPTLTMEDGSHIGTDGDENEGGKVSITANDVTVGADSYITSSDDVNITTESADGKLSITMNGASSDTADGWIKGDSVNIGGLTTNPGHLPVEGSSPTISISGGKITATGNPATEGSGEINIAIGGNGTSSESENTVNGTQIGTGDESIKVAGNGSLAIDNGASVVGDSVTVEAPSLVMDNGSHIGSDEGGTSTGGDVKISANDVTVGDDSYITSEGAVSVTAKDPSKDLSIEMTGGVDGVTEEGWIKGDSVTIGSNKQEGTTTVAGGSITSTGDTGIKIEVGDNGKLDLADTQLDSTGSVTIIGAGSVAGSDIAAGGDVVFGARPGNKEHFVDVTGGTSISGNGLTVMGDTTLTLGDKDDASDSNTVNIGNGGEVTVEGELNIAGGNDIKGEGDLTINTGTTGNGTVNVAEGGLITADANDEGETGNTGDMTITGNGTVNVAGGKLEANGDGNSGGNIKVEGGDVNLSDNGSIEAGGTVTIGGGQKGASVNVAAGETGTIVAGSNKEDGGNNLVIGNNGTLNVGNDGVDENGNTINEGSLLITNEKDPDNRPTQLPGGVMIDKDTTVAVEDGGHFVSDDIAFNEEGDGEDGKLNIGSGGSIYTDADTIINNVKPDGSGNINIAKPGEDDKGATVQISGTVSAEKGEDGKSELDKINEALKDSGTTIVFDSIDGVPENEIISEKELDETYNNTVIGDAIIDVSGGGGNDLTQGGGGSIMVGPTDESDNTFTIRPDDDNKGVTITGSEKDPNKEIVVGKGEDGKPVTDGTFDIDLEDGADLTLGKDGAAGGTLSGSITATTSDGSENKPSDVTVNGGNFTVEGSIDLTHPDAEGGATSDDDGNITIYDHNTTNPDAENGLTVAGDVAAGNLEMSGGDTNLDVGGDLSLSGGASLTGNADVDVAGSITVDDVLDMSGTSSLGKDHAASDAADEGTEGNLTVGGLDITDSASVDRNEVDVNGNAHINGNGGLTADGNFDVTGELQIGTGEDIDGNETAAGNPTVSVSGDITTGKDFTVGNAEGEGSATVEATNDITVSDGNATIHGNGQVTAGGSFDVNGSGDNGNATIEGSLTANDADIDNDLTVGKEDGGSLEPNGSFVTDGSTNVGGNVVVNENGELSVGMNASGDDEGNLTVGGSLTTGAGSNVDVGGDLSVEESASIAGNVEVGGAADFNSGLTVGADPDNEGNVPNPNGSFTSGGKTDVNGNLIVNGNSSVSVGLAPSGEDDDSLKVENGYADIDAGSTVTVGGAFEVTGTGGAGDEGEPTQGSAHVAGSVAADSANISQDLVVGDAFKDGKAPSNNGSFVTDNDAEVGGNVTVNDNGTLTVGTDKGEGPADLTIGGSLTTSAGSDSTVTGNLVVGNNGEADATIGGSLTVNGSGVEGTPSADFNGDLTVEAGGAFNNTAVVDGTTDTLVSGILTVGSAEEGAQQATANLGDAEVAGQTTVNNGKVTSGDFTGKGDARISGAGTSFDATGDITLAVTDDQGQLTGEQPNLIIKDGASVSASAQEGGDSKGDVTVGGYASVTTGSLTADGKLTISGTAADSGNGLVVGNQDAQPNEGGAYDKTTNVTVGSIEVDGKTQVYGDGTLEANGEAAFGGGLKLGAGGAFVNSDAEADTIVNNEFILNAGASVDTKGEFKLDGVSTIGNTDGLADGSGNLHGTISAGSIDLGNLTGNTITFAGGTTGTDGDETRFEAGFETSKLTGNVALSNGANAVLTPSADGEAPVVNGWINVNAGKDGSLGSTLTTNAANKGDYSNADVASGNSTNAVVNMDSSINFTGSNSGLIVGDVGTPTPSESGIYFGANSSLVIDASNMTSGSVLFGNGTADGMDIKVVGDNTTVSVDLSGWTMGTGGSLVFDVSEDDKGKFEFTSSNVLQQFGINDGKIQMTVADIGAATGGTLDSALQDVVGKVTANAGNTYVGQAFNEVFSSASGLTALDPNNEQDKAVIDDLTASGAVPDGATNIIKTPFGYQYTKDGKTVLALNGNGNKAVEEIATFPVTAGAFNATYEYLTEFNRAVETRALEDRPEGRSQSVWAHVIATFNKSEDLFGGSGYSADLYGGVLGTDVVVGGNTLVGGALTVGNGDIESRGAVIDSKNDATFYGVSLYAEHNIGAMSVKGDVTYLKTENDISSTFNGVNMGGSMDTDAISVGIRAEFKAYESDSFEVKPHLGIRYTNYSFDNYRGTDIDDVNAIESPVGVAFSGKVKAEGGWTVVPELDLSVVPQLGDRKATVVNAGAGVDQTILEGAIFNAKLGLGLTKDNFSFGLNYQHGAGGFGRNNNAFQAHARWLF